MGRAGMAGRRQLGFRVYVRRTFCTQVLWSRECKTEIEILRLRFRSSYWTHEIPEWAEELWALLFEKGKLLRRKASEEIYWLPPIVADELKAIIEKVKKEKERMKLRA